MDRASPQRLNKCINFGGSPRAHASIAGRGEGGSASKLASPALNTQPSVFLSSSFSFFFYLNRIEVKIY